MAVAANDAAPVVQVVQLVITQALRDRASDIHIEPQEERVRVRYRIDGALHDVLDLPGSMGPAMVSRIKILGGMNIVERRRPQDGQISTDIEGRGVDIRVSTTAIRRRREGRAALARQETVSLQARTVGHARGHVHPILRAAACAVRHGDLCGPDR
jgi:type II secretory ATPase GspE/PulE/Tfp pilus assembly ATPase PilB-like protein